MNGNETWLALAIDEGQLGCAQGVVVGHRGHFAVLTDSGTVTVAEDGTPISSSMTVDLRSTTEGFDLAPFENQNVVVTGHLEAGGLVVDTAGSFASRSVARGRPTHVAAAPRGSAAPGPLRYGLRPADERALMEDGLLLDLWQPDSRLTRYVALATDVDVVQRTLGRRYGSSLQVIQSTYSEAILGAAESLIVSSGKAMAFGRDHGPDLQMRVNATLLHLPRELALSLSEFPTGVLAIDVLIRPAGFGAGNDPAHRSDSQENSTL